MRGHTSREAAGRWYRGKITAEVVLARAMYEEQQWVLKNHYPWTVRRRVKGDSGAFRRWRRFAFWKKDGTRPPSIASPQATERRRRFVFPTGPLRKQGCRDAIHLLTEYIKDIVGATMKDSPRRAYARLGLQAPMSSKAFWESRTSQRNHARGRNRNQEPSTRLAEI